MEKSHSATTTAVSSRSNGLTRMLVGQSNNVPAVARSATRTSGQELEVQHQSSPISVVGNTAASSVGSRASSVSRSVSRCALGDSDSIAGPYHHPAIPFNFKT